MDRARNVALVVLVTFASACGGKASEGESGAGGAGHGGTGSGGAPVAAPSKCKLNSECPGGLVCSFGLCHAECLVSRDCPSGQRCVTPATAASGTVANVCQLQSEARCVYNSDCDSPLVCATDLQCRNECASDRDCASGQRCAFGVCAEPTEINSDGSLKGTLDAGMGFPGNVGGSSGAPGP